MMEQNHQLLAFIMLSIIFYLSFFFFERHLSFLLSKGRMNDLFIVKYQLKNEDTLTSVAKIVNKSPMGLK